MKLEESCYKDIVDCIGPHSVSFFAAPNSTFLSSLDADGYDSYAHTISVWDIMRIEEADRRRRSDEGLISDSSITVYSQDTQPYEIYIVNCGPTGFEVRISPQFTSITEGQCIDLIAKKVRNE